MMLQQVWYNVVANRSQILEHVKDFKIRTSGNSELKDAIVNPFYSILHLIF